MFNRLMALPLLAHGAILAIALTALGVVKSWLDASYAASMHPVDYATGQTAFSAEKVMGWYARMQETGTLGVYFRTQVIDFAFLTMIAVLGIVLGTLAARLAVPGSWGRRLKRIAFDRVQPIKRNTQHS